MPRWRITVEERYTTDVEAATEEEAQQYVLEGDGLTVHIDSQHIVRSVLLGDD